MTAERAVQIRGRQLGTLTHIIRHAGVQSGDTSTSTPTGLPRLASQRRTPLRLRDMPGITPGSRLAQVGGASIATNTARMGPTISTAVKQDSTHYNANVREVQAALARFVAQAAVQYAKVEPVRERFSAAIDEASHILQWEDDWDGEGSPAYQAATLERAREFLLTGIKGLRPVQMEHVPVPRVTPGPDGSIDLHWRQPERHLLVNIPPAGDDVISCYGHDDRSEVKAEFTNSADARWVFDWLGRAR